MPPSGKDKEKDIAKLKHMENLLRMQIGFFERTAREEISIEVYECRLQAILPLYDRYSDIYGSYIAENDEDMAEREKAMDTFVQDYFAIVPQINERLREMRNAIQAALSPHPVVQSSAPVRAPKIQLPVFDGSIEKWIKFRDIFESLIHNRANISNIEKFSYLESSMKLPLGHANVLDNFKVSDSDYEAAWKAVCDRYNDKRKIVAMHCTTLFEVPKMSSESASEIRRILDSFSSQISALRQIGIVLNEAEDFANTIIVQMVLLRLEENTLREWRKFQSADLATWKELHDFLVVQWRSIDDGKMSSLKSSNEGKQAKSLYANNSSSAGNQNNVRSSSIKCHLCFESHYLWACPKFSSMNVDERQKVVKEKKLCLNCFSPQHQVKNCSSKFCCKTCSRKHHTFLHFDRSIETSYSPSSSSLSAESKPFEPFQMVKEVERWSRDFQKFVSGVIVVEVNASAKAKHFSLHGLNRNS